MDEKILLIKYQEDFADNLSTYANAKIIAKKNNLKYCYENSPEHRELFEKKMSCLKMNCSYISSARAKEITKKAYNSNKKYRTNHYVDKNIFSLNDIEKLTPDIINDLRFNNNDFIVNHDLLEEIKKYNSIGLYINSSDDIDYTYINKALKRLNKYIKQPKLYIFSANNFSKELYLDYKLMNIDDYKEEFYLLTACKNKIILNSSKSYSYGFWASILNQKDYTYVIYDKSLKVKHVKRNWISV